VLLDAALHALAAWQDMQDTTWQLKSAKFHSPVQPGEVLTLHATESPAGGFASRSAAGIAAWRAAPWIFRK